MTRSRRGEEQDNHGKGMPMITGLIARHRTRIAATAVVSVVAGLMNMWLIRLANGYAAGIDELGQAIGYYAGVLCGLFAIGMLFQQAMTALSARIFYEARKELTARISALSYQQMEHIGRHRILSALSHDLADINQLVTLLPNYVYNATVALACMFYLATLSPKLFAVALLFMTVGVTVSRQFIFRRGEQKFREMRKVQDRLFQCYHGVVDGHKELTLHAARKERFHAEELDSASTEYRVKALQAGFYWNLANNWNLLVVFASIGTVIFVSHGVLQSPPKSLLPFLVVILYLTGPISQLLNGLRVISRAKVAIGRLTELGIFQNRHPQAASSARISEPFQTLSLRGVRYRYEGDSGDAFAVGPLDLEIERGDIVYLVGGNGSGKTTAAKLIAGLYARHDGEIRVNGELVPADVPSDYHEYFSSIFADYHLFETMIPKARNTLDRAAIKQMLDELQLAEKTGFDGDRMENVKLSQGQRKRLALLAACCEQSEIYLFDEWAAEQDPQFRDYFYRSFLPAMKRAGKTVIVVTHDDRYFQFADRLVKFEQGVIVSQSRGVLESEHPRHAERTHSIEPELSRAG